MGSKANFWRKHLEKFREISHFALTKLWILPVRTSLNRACSAKLRGNPGAHRFWYGTHDFLLTFHSHHCPISHRFRDIGHFRRKSPIFSYPRVHIAPDEGGLEFGIGVRGPKCLNDGPTRRSKKFSDRFSRFDTIPAVTDSHPASHPATQPASHVAVAIRLFAKASSLKMWWPWNPRQRSLKVNESDRLCMVS